MRAEQEIFVKHKINPGKNGYGKQYYVYVFETTDGEQLIWSTTSEKVAFSEGDVCRISFDCEHDEDGNMNKYIQRVSVIKSFLTRRVR